MPLIDATGTSVERMSPESVKKSIAPERSWLSMSVSEPSWLLGNTWISTRPLVSALMRSIASTARMVSGCVTGELLAYFSANSGAALATHGIANRLPAATPVLSAVRRVLKIVMRSPPMLMSLPPLAGREELNQRLDGTHHFFRRQSHLVFERRRERHRDARGREPLDPRNPASTDALDHTCHHFGAKARDADRLVHDQELRG